MTITWRTFKFLQDGDGRKVDFPGPTTCCSAGREDLFFGCEGGVVHVLDRNLQDKLTFSAYGHNVLHMYDFKKRQCLLTIGTEEAGVSSTVLKCWNLDQLFPGRGNAAQPLKTHKIFSNKLPEADVTCLCVHEWEENNAVVAIGLASGIVYWFSGDTVNHKVNMNRLDARPLGNDLWCVKGMGFSNSGALHLFVVTESQTLVFNLQNDRKAVLDEAGCTDGGILMGEDGQLLVARPQALYFYTVEGRGACFAFNEQHHHLAWAGRNLVVVHETVMANGASSSEVKFFDLGNKLVVGQRPVLNVKHIISVWDMIMAVQGDGTILSWRQIPLTQRLELLFRRNCHTIALRLAEEEGASKATLAHIYQQYGDHLYHDKHDYDTAMQQYLCTIGHLEPSYVIRKYLDAQRIHQLTLYLEALHNDGRANADHTTLLLNCYTKLKDVEKLDVFIGIGETSEEGFKNGQKRKFDMETAIKVLRGAGYYNHALEIARSANEPYWILDILLEDQGDYDEGIKFVFQLQREKAAEAMNKYGKVLVTHRPRDSTGCLMKLCVPEQSKIEDPSAEFAAKVSDYAHLYADKLGALVELCEFVFLVYRHLSKSPPDESHLYHTLLELYLSEPSQASMVPQTPTEEKNPEEEANPEEEPSEDFGTDMPSRDVRLEKALALLGQGWTLGDPPKYDPEHVLVLCRMHGFKKGLVFLYERKGLLREVLQVYIAAKDYTGIIEACRNYGDAFRGGDPQLWSEALEYFSSHTEECTVQVQEVLQSIERQDVLPPLVVLQTLAKNPKLKLKVVKGYIAAQLQKDSKSIAEDRKEITRLTLETAEMRKQIHELKTEPQVCQGHVDEQTKQPLELPAVHFLCHHSFNLRTLGDDASECPICRVQNQETLRIRRDMKAGAAHQDQFFMELKGNKDGFGVIAEWFGRGMLNVRSSN